jgi:hypothetical protein
MLALQIRSKTLHRGKLQKRKNYIGGVTRIAPQRRKKNTVFDLKLMIPLMLK